MKTMLQNIQNKVRGPFLAEGGNGTGIPFVTAYHFTAEKIQLPQTENPHLYLVLDGTLRLHTPSGIMDYMAGQYSIE